MTPLWDLLHSSLPQLKYILPAVAIVLVILYALIGRRPLPGLRGFLAAILVALALLSVYNYTAVHLRSGSYFNAYEFFHYYLGAKYSEEIGYNNLYKAALIADQETGYKHKGRRVRDLETGRSIPGATVLAKKEQVKAHFSDERWQEFVQDAPFFRGFVSDRLWGRMLTDKGYNATPVWTMVSGTLANAVPTTNRKGMTGLALLDVLFFAAALGCVAWAFSPRAALLLTVFLCTHYLTSHFTLKAAFLRLDWVMCLLIAISLLKKGRHKTAGVFTAYAALSRVFPVLFVFGIAAKLLTGLLRNRSLDRKLLGYLLAFTGTVIIFVSASVLYHGGFDIWRDFAHKLSDHNDDISAWRMGFKYVFLMSYQGNAFWGVGLAQFFQDHQAAWWSIQALVLVLSLILVARLEDYEAMIYGIVPVFFLTAATYYYYVMLAVPFLFFAAKIERPTRALGLVLMFSTALIGHQCYTWWGRGYQLYFTMSCLVLAMAVYMMFCALLTFLQKETEQEDEPEACEEPAQT